jgi:hypothetical protein
MTNLHNLTTQGIEAQEEKAPREWYTCEECEGSGWARVNYWSCHEEYTYIGGERFATAQGMEYDEITDSTSWQCTECGNYANPQQDNELTERE